MGWNLVSGSLEMVLVGIGWDGLSKWNIYIYIIYGVLVGIHYILYVVYVGLSKLRSFNHLHRQTDRLRKNVFDQF